MTRYGKIAHKAGMDSRGYWEQTLQNAGFSYEQTEALLELAEMLGAVWSAEEFSEEDLRANEGDRLHDMAKEDW